MDIQSIIAKQHNAVLFLREFVFATNTFTPPGSSEVEFADAVVMLGDVLIIFQIKERSSKAARDASSERRWFEKKVLGTATRQIRDTFAYLNEHSEIILANERGIKFNLAASNYKDVIKVVLYKSSDSLPEECKRIHSHISKTVGLIHVIEVKDYIDISRTLRVPMDIVEYLKFREKVLQHFSQECADVSERAFAGQFIEDNCDDPPNSANEEIIERIVDDESEWNLGPLLLSFQENMLGEDFSTDYYKILLEVAKLPRSAWRGIKERIDLTHKNVQEDQSVLPYRFAYPPTDCGFVFVPVHSQLSKNPDWPRMKIQAIKNFTYAHKYDQRLLTCIGVIASKHAEYIDLDWCYMSFPWKEDLEMQARLESDNPFRPVNEKTQFGYFTYDN